MMNLGGLFWMSPPPSEGPQNIVAADKDLEGRGFVAAGSLRRGSRRRPRGNKMEGTTRDEKWPRISNILVMNEGPRRSFWTTRG